MASASRAEPTRQRRGDATRQAIFDAAAVLFASKGYSATGVRDIAAAAGVNQALVSYHFGGKSALYDEILSEGVAHAAARAEAMKLDAGGADAPRQLVRIFADALSSRPHLAPMVLREQLDPNRLLEPEAQRRLMGFMDLTRRVLETSPLRAEAKRYDPQIVHLICIGPIIHFLVAQRVREASAPKLDGALTTPTLDSFVETLGDILVLALEQPS